VAGGAAEPVGSAKLELVSGVALLREEDAVLEAMLAGWARQQAGGRGLAPKTIGQRQAVVRQFLGHAGEYPWNWTAAHLVCLGAGAGLIRGDLRDVRGTDVSCSQRLGDLVAGHGVGKVVCDAGLIGVGS
jgi:hypothetical protein